MNAGGKWFRDRCMKRKKKSAFGNGVRSLRHRVLSVLDACA
jgi:hypothetical protein